MNANIRYATLEDLPAITQIYNHYVLETAVTFDTEPFSAESRQPWFSQFEFNSLHHCLVAEQDNAILGYACASIFRPKPAYQQSVETTIYLAPDAIGQGIGKRLYGELLENLEARGAHRCYGIIALPNAPSMTLHQNFGFSQIGLLTEVGFKFGKYHDTAWLEKKL